MFNFDKYILSKDKVDLLEKRIKTHKHHRIFDFIYEKKQKKD